MAFRLHRRRPRFAVSLDDLRDRGILVASLRAADAIQNVVNGK